MSERYFTVEEANKALPLVKRIVADILSDYDVWRDRMHHYELASAGGSGEEGESAEQVALREEVDDVAHRINGYMEELAPVGCVFKGFDGGLVDFYAKRDGRDVFLCWKYGEATVEFWHELDDGFTGRQPLEPETVSEDA